MSNPRGETPSPGRPGAMSPVSDGSFRKRETPPPGRPGAMSPVNDGSFRKLSSSPKLGATAGETAPSTSSPLGSRRDGAPTDFLYQLEAARRRVVLRAVRAARLLGKQRGLNTLNKYPAEPHTAGR